MTLYLPFKDAAPAATGAGVNGLSTSADPPLDAPPKGGPARLNAPTGTPNAGPDRIAGHAREPRARAQAFIVGKGAHGTPDDKGEAASGIKPQTFSPQRRERAALRLVADSGRPKKTEIGRPQEGRGTSNHALKSTGEINRGINGKGPA